MRWLLACVLALGTSVAQADGPLYAEFQIGAAGVRNGDLDFVPKLASVSAGFYLRKGIGLEIFADRGISTDRKDGFDLDLEGAHGIALRLESPAVRRTRGFLILGAVEYSINQQSVTTTGQGDSSIDGDFTGLRVSLGITERLERWDNVLVSVEYRHYNADEPLRVDALYLGLRINTP